MKAIYRDSITEDGIHSFLTNEKLKPIQLTGIIIGIAGIILISIYNEHGG